MITDDSVLMILAAGVAAWGLWLVFRRHQLTAQVQRERLQTLSSMIDKFSSAGEFAAFLDTEAARRLLDDSGYAADDPFRSVRRFVQAGIILVVLGSVFFIIAAAMNSLRGELSEDALYWGTFFAGLGLAFGLVAVATRVMIRRLR